jgi:hypothetical protein
MEIQKLRFGYVIAADLSWSISTANSDAINAALCGTAVILKFD